MKYPYVGIDLTAGKRASDLVALNAAGTRSVFHQVLTDDDLCATVATLGGSVVAIDSPMGLPAGLCCLEESCSCRPIDGAVGRSAERALAARGIPCFWTTKRTIIKSMVLRAIRLRSLLLEARCEVLEVYPYAVKRVLLGPALPRKTVPEAARIYLDGARVQLPRCRWPEGWRPTHDQVDALYCALTAYLHRLGRTESLGDPAEVPIIIPRVGR